MTTNMPSFPPTAPQTAQPPQSKSFMDIVKASMKPDAADMEVWKLVTSFPELSMLLRAVVLILNIIFPGVGTILMGVIGKPFSKVQVVIGIIQFFVSWAFIRYLWAIGWGILGFLKGMIPSQAAPQAAQGPQGEPGKAYDVGAIGQPNPFESMGGMS